MYSETSESDNISMYPKFSINSSYLDFMRSSNSPEEIKFYNSIGEEVTLPSHSNSHVILFIHNFSLFVNCLKK